MTNPSPHPFGFSILSISTSSTPSPTVENTPPSNSHTSNMSGIIGQVGAIDVLLFTSTVVQHLPFNPPSSSTSNITLTS